MNPQSGKQERVFVDLAAVYPTPEEPGSELSFEEIWAANRGWLNQVWDDEVDQIPEVGEVSDQVAEKLVVHETVMLDENGAIKGKGKKMKVMEVNETQISRCSG